MNWGIMFGTVHEDSGMVGYTDANENSNEDHHAISRYVFMLNESFIDYGPIDYESGIYCCNTHCKRGNVVVHVYWRSF